MANASVVVVGAGPVGSLLATLLAERGCQVAVCEARPDMRQQTVGGGRSINLAVSVRGLHALQQIGLDGAVLDCTVPMTGRLIHGRDGSLQLQAYGKDASQRIHSMSRGGLNQILMTRAEQTGRVTIAFEHRLTGYDFATQTAQFATPRGSLEVAAPVIFGTDGSASALRGAMNSCGLEQTVAPLDFGYKELTMLPASGGFAMEPNALHIWPRGRFMLIALPNPDCSFTCTLFLPHQGDGATPSFADLAHPSAIANLFADHFADLLPLMPDAAEQFARAPLGHMATLRCSPWSRDGALLLGDAAHAIVPFFGQGMNAGFESCWELAQQLDRDGLPQSPAQWAAAFGRFWPRRKPDTDAIAQLALENFVEMRDKVADPTYLLHREVEARIQRLLGDAYATRYQLVSFSRVPYRQALALGQVQAQVLAEACAGCGSADEVGIAQAAARMRDALAAA